MPPRIQAKTLTPEDIGRPVVYRDPGSRRVEQGVLSSFREDGEIFVRFKGPGGERCPPERLSWLPDMLTHQDVERMRARKND